MKNGEDQRSPTVGAAARSRSATDAGLKSRQKVIGAGLKRLFDDVVDEEMPDDFANLLSKLDANDGPGGVS